MDAFMLTGLAFTVFREVMKDVELVKAGQMSEAEFMGRWHKSAEESRAAREAWEASQAARAEE